MPCKGSDPANCVIGGGALNCGAFLCVRSDLCDCRESAREMLFAVRPGSEGGSTSMFMLLMFDVGLGEYGSGMAAATLAGDR